MTRTSLENQAYGQTFPTLLVGVVVDRSRNGAAPGSEVTYTVTAMTEGGATTFYNVTPANRRAAPALDVQPAELGTPCLGFVFNTVSAVFWISEQDAVGDCNA